MVRISLAHLTTRVVVDGKSSVVSWWCNVATIACNSRHNKAKVLRFIRNDFLPTPTETVPAIENHSGRNWDFPSVPDKHGTQDPGLATAASEHVSLHLCRGQSADHETASSLSTPSAAQAILISKTRIDSSRLRRVFKRSTWGYRAWSINY